MSRKYIEARKSFSGLTSEQLSSEDEIDVNDDRITLTLKPPPGEKPQIDSSPSLSMERHYLSLYFANLEARDKVRSQVDQHGAELAGERSGYASGAVGQLEVPSGKQIQDNPFAFQALSTPVRPDQGAHVVCERDLAKNCGVTKETSITGNLLGPETQRVESHFLAIQAPPSDDSQGVLEETRQSHQAQGLATEDRAGRVTEYCFLDVKSVTATDDPCPMLFGQKLSRRPLAENSDEKQDLPRQTEDNTYKSLAANTEASKEPCSRPEELVPPPRRPSVVANPEKDTSGEVKKILAAKEQLVLEEAEAIPNSDKEVKEQADSGVVKRVGRIIKLPASVVGSGPLDFDDRSGSPWNSKKRLRTGYDRASSERDYAKTKPSRERVCGSDGEEERNGRSRRYRREEEFPRHGRRVTTARDFSPRRASDRNDMYNLKISTTGPTRNVFNRIPGPSHKETVFNRLNYGEYDDTMVVDRDYRQHQDLRYREDSHGSVRFPRSRGMYTGSSSRDNDISRPTVKSGAYHPRSPERDYSRSPDKMNNAYPRAISETHTPIRDIETSDTLRPSKLSGWDRVVEGTREPEVLASYIPFADRMNGRSRSPDGYVAERSRKMRFDSPSDQRLPRERSGSIYDERINQRASSHHSVGRQPESWEPLHGYNTLEPNQKKQRPIRSYSDEESPVAEVRAPGGLKQEAFGPKASLQDFLGSGRSYPSTLNPLDIMEQPVVMSAKEHLDMHEMNGDKELVDYLGEFDSERKNGKLGFQARDKERTSSSTLQNSVLGASGDVRSSRDAGPRELYDLNFAISHPENFSAARNKNIRGRMDHYLSWEERDSRHTSAGSREIPPSDVWPEERLELSINRYREKVAVCSLRYYKNIYAPTRGCGHPECHALPCFISGLLNREP